MTALPFVDLQAQRRRLQGRIDTAIQRVLAEGQFILGPETQRLEEHLAAFAGTPHCISCGNGTDAIVLVLMAEEIGPGDAVIMPAFTFVATAEAAALCGATPYFIDVDPVDFAIDPQQLATAVADAKQLGLRPRAVIAVDLFGMPADYGRLAAAASTLGLVLIADAAQSFGGCFGNRMVGSLADYTTTSFFPSKPLGCYGDGGAIFTAKPARAELLRSLRFHGKGSDKYDNVRIGMNSRLDTLQAAILLEKLTIFPEELESRQKIAAAYTERLEPLAPRILTPSALLPDRRSAWALYTLRSPERTRLREACTNAGIPTHVYYPIPLNQQTGYSRYPVLPDGVPVSERLATEVFSIPMHPYLTPADQDRIVRTLETALNIG